MAVQPLPCDSCGSPISDSDLETGTAITLIGKRYCSGCKTEAIQNVSLEELSPQAAPGRPAPPKPQARPSKAPAPVPRAPEVKAAPPPARSSAAAAARLDRKTPARRPADTARPRSVAILLVAVAVVVLLAAGALLLLRSGEPEPAGGSASAVRPSPTGPASGAAKSDREGQAREAYTRVEEMGRRPGSSWDLVLAAAEKARPVCAGTAWNAPLEELRSRAQREKEAEDAARELAPLIDELKGAVATDPEFKRYTELQPKFRLALEMAGRIRSPRMQEIRALHMAYNGSYEKLAEPFYDRINEAASALADEHRYDDALKQLDTFPQQFRQSGAWQNLERLRQDIERRKQTKLKK